MVQGAATASEFTGTMVSFVSEFETFKALQHIYMIAESGRHPFNIEIAKWL